MIVLAVIGFWINISDKNQEKLIEESNGGINEGQLQNGDQYAPFSPLNFKLGELLLLIGASKEEVHKKLGKPVRIDDSGYGYVWWIYNKNKAEYVQIGIENEKVVTAYVMGKNADVQPFYIDQPIGDIYAMNLIDTNVVFEYEDRSYRLELSEEDINTNPLIVMNHIFVQLYIDKFTGKLSSVRLMDAPTLMKIRPYELLFLGDLLVPVTEFKKDEKRLKAAREKQLYELINNIRSRHGLKPLEKDKELAQAAYAHCVKMDENDELADISERDPVGTDELKAGEGIKISSGENTAYQSIDPADVVEGWLNNNEYRENLLNEEFTHFGAGVYLDNYTLVLLKKPQHE